MRCRYPSAFKITDERPVPLWHIIFLKLPNSTIDPISWSVTAICKNTIISCVLRAPRLSNNLLDHWANAEQINGRLKFKCNLIAWWVELVAANNSLVDSVLSYVLSEWVSDWVYVDWKIAKQTAETESGVFWFDQLHLSLICDCKLEIRC